MKSEEQRWLLRLFRHTTKTAFLSGSEVSIMSPHVYIEEEVSRLDKLIPELIRLMIPPLNRLVWSRWKMCLEGLFISKKFPVANTSQKG